MKGKIAMILWQDLRPGREWNRCVTSVIRDSVRAMPGSEQLRWLVLFQSFPHTVVVEPPKKWNPRRIPVEEFVDRMKEWLVSVLSAAELGLTAAGSHILKNLVWCSIDCADPDLDSRWTELLFALPRDTTTHDKVAAAVSYMLTFRKPERARAPSEGISARFSHPGGKIEQYRRIAERNGKASATR